MQEWGKSARLLGCCAIQSSDFPPMFRENMLPPSSGLSTEAATTRDTIIRTHIIVKTQNTKKNLVSLYRPTHISFYSANHALCSQMSHRVVCYVLTNATEDLTAFIITVIRVTEAVSSRLHGAASQNTAIFILFAVKNLISHHS